MIAVSGQFDVPFPLQPCKQRAGTSAMRADFIHSFGKKRKYLAQRSKFPCCNLRSVGPYSACLTETNGSGMTGASGCSSGVEHNLAKVGVEGSNPFARSSHSNQVLRRLPTGGLSCFRAPVSFDFSQSISSKSVKRFCVREC